MKNTIVIIGIVIECLVLLITTTFFLSGCKKDGTLEKNGEKVISMESLVSTTNVQSESSFAEGVFRPSSAPPTQTKVPESLLEEYRGKTGVFEYKLKETYSNREEVLTEMNILSACCKAFLENKVSKRYQEEMLPSINIRDGLMKQLEVILKKFPPSEREIKQMNVDRFYDHCGFIENDFHIAKSDYEHFITKGHDTDAYGHRPDKNKIISGYEEKKSKYEAAKAAKSDYESGKISIEDAFERVGRMDLFNSDDWVFSSQ